MKTLDQMLKGLSAGRRLSVERGYWQMVLDAYLAQGIETRSAETEGLGPKDESPVPKGCAQDTGARSTP